MYSIAPTFSGLQLTRHCSFQEVQELSALEDSSEYNHLHNHKYSNWLVRQ